jgi:hypothetical protein
VAKICDIKQIAGIIKNCANLRDSAEYKVKLREIQGASFPLLLVVFSEKIETQHDRTTLLEHGIYLPNILLYPFP